MTTPTVPSITDEQLNELEGFLYEAENLGPMTDCETVLALIARLRAAERDAERYRWLRDIEQLEPDQFAAVNEWLWGDGDFSYVTEAIDRAMQEQKQ